MEDNGLYVNGVAIYQSDHDFVISLLENLPAFDQESKKTHLNTLKRCSAFMTPVLFKKLFQEMQEQLEQYEKRNGKINVESESPKLHGGVKDDGKSETV